MKPKIVLGLVGDYSAEIPAHRAIPLALTAASEEAQCEIDVSWLSTRELREPARQLADFDGLWIVPGSPYANMIGVIDVICWARKNKRPLLASCGGFQHLLIEYARNVAGLFDADHAETNPAGRTLVITRLRCLLANKNGRVHFLSDTKIRAIYARDSANVRYNCNFGVNSSHRAALQQAGLRFSAFDDSGEIRAAELESREHPFFLGTLFQSERAALEGKPVPLASALLRAAQAHCAKM